MKPSKLPKHDQMTQMKHHAKRLSGLVAAVTGGDRTLLPDSDLLDDTCGAIFQLQHLIRPRLQDLSTAHSTMKMCSALAYGALDSAINLAWNVTNIGIRKRLSDFADTPELPRLIKQRIASRIETHVQDKLLLPTGCRFGLYNEQGTTDLFACSKFRHKASAAHPPEFEAGIEDFMLFLDIAWGLVFSGDDTPVTTDFQSLLIALTRNEISEEGRQHWKQLIDTYPDSQRSALVEILHALYCESPAKGPVRSNIVKLCQACGPAFSGGVLAGLNAQHLQMKISGAETTYTASRTFLTKMHWLEPLARPEVDEIVTHWCDRQMQIHSDLNNFRREPNIAQILMKLLEHDQVPRPVGSQFVQTIVTCAVGNHYGWSYEAAEHYENTIRQFKGQEVSTMLSLSRSDAEVGELIRTNDRCRERFAELLSLIPSTQVPRKRKQEYDRWIQEYYPANSK